MKKLSILISFFFVAVVTFGHAINDTFPNNQRVSNVATLYHALGGFVADLGLVNTRFPDTATANLNYISQHPGGQIIVANTVYIRDITATRWIANGTGGGGSTIAGGPISSVDVIGFDPGSNITPGQFIDSVFYRAQPPLATLTGGGIFEFTSAATVSGTLTWSASRQNKTASLATIVVGGISQTFVNPSAPGTVSGTQNATVTTNTNTTYSNVVTATDGKTATATTDFIYESKYYIGFVSTSTPSDADIIAALGTTAGGVFATSRLTSGTLPDPASLSYIVFAYPTSFGAASAIKINGLNVFYNLTTRSFVNASGYAVSYNIYLSPFNTNGGIDYQIL